MNAYELADYLCNTELRIPNHNEIKAANMLRQQADRIAELKKKNGQLEFMVGYLEEEVAQLKD